MTLGELKALVDLKVLRLGTSAPVRVRGYYESSLHGNQYLHSASDNEYDDGRRCFELVVRKDKENEG